MTVTCPQGHTTSATDYCDVCGAPIGAQPAPVATGSGGADPTSCPHCGTPAAPAALFCESCGYDFTTGALPADPLTLDPVPADPPTGQLPTGPAGGSAPAQSTSAASGPPASSSVPPIPGAVTWVAELWVDPDWYDHQPVSPEDPLPAVGPPTVVPLRQRTVLVGRPSRSRGIDPQVDCTPDVGVSRRHCQLTTDGLRWWVEDLQSSNGTFVAAPGAPLPDDPIVAGERRELADADRVFVGGWTRLVVRTALPGEL